MSEKNYLTPGEVAEQLDIHPATVRRWREKSKGPRAVRTPGGWHRYPRRDFNRWVKENMPEVTGYAEEVA